MVQTFISADEVKRQAAAHGGVIDFALSLLDTAASCAVAPVSQFYVGAVAVDADGNFYLGANQECAAAAMAQTVHAEQSAVSHAWHRGAAVLTDIVVNYTPCGHCRQFLNELRGAENLRIHLPHSRDNLLHSYLPDSFGPADLQMPKRLLDAQQHALHWLNAADAEDALFQAACAVAAQSHAPYTRAYAGVALQLADGSTVCGRYAENAAYNPTLPPLQSAVNLLRVQGGTVADVTAAVLVCTEHGGHEAHTRALWAVCSDAPLRVAYVRADEEAA